MADKYITKDLFDRDDGDWTTVRDLSSIINRCKELGLDPETVNVEADLGELEITYKVENPKYKEELKEEKQRAQKYKNYLKDRKKFEIELTELRKKYGLE